MDPFNIQIKQEGDASFCIEQDYGSAQESHNSLENKKSDIKMIKEEDDSIDIKEEEIFNDAEMNIPSQEEKKDVSVY